MPNFNVMVNWTHTINASVEVEVKAKSEEEAQEKAEKKISAAQEKATEEKPLMKMFDWDVTDESDEFEYEPEEA